VAKLSKNQNEGFRICMTGHNSCANGSDHFIGCIEQFL